MVIKYIFFTDYIILIISMKFSDLLITNQLITNKRITDIY